MAKPELLNELNPILRVTGQAIPLDHIVQHGLYAEVAHVQLDPPLHDPDPTVIDSTLYTEAPAEPPSAPALGLGYAGFSPRQRHEFLKWAAHHATRQAPPAFQQLYCAHLEARLLENATAAAAAQAEMHRLYLADAWRKSRYLARTQLLAFWLAQDGAGLAAWLGLGLAPPDLAGVAVGLQALLGQPLDAREVLTLSHSWRLAHAGSNVTVPTGSTSDTKPANAEILRLHLSSLENSLGCRVLQYVLDRLPEEARLFKPWRTNHRGLRVRFPQPDLRSGLLPLLRDLYSLPGQENAVGQADPIPDSDDDKLPDRSWQLILEFGHSRSEFFDVVIRNVQKLPGYSQLMDENRQLVHRVHFKRSDLRRFWRIWDYVQSWSSTRVYLNGQELEKWKIWPYSQYLQ